MPTADRVTCGDWPSSLVCLFFAAQTAALGPATVCEQHATETACMTHYPACRYWAGSCKTTVPLFTDNWLYCNHYSDSHPFLTCDALTCEYRRGSSTLCTVHRNTLASTPGVNEIQCIQDGTAVWDSQLLRCHPLMFGDSGLACIGTTAPDCVHPGCFWHSGALQCLAQPLPVLPSSTGSAAPTPYPFTVISGILPTPRSPLHLLRTPGTGHAANATLFAPGEWVTVVVTLSTTQARGAYRLHIVPDSVFFYARPCPETGSCTLHYTRQDLGEDVWSQSHQPMGNSSMPVMACAGVPGCDAFVIPAESLDTAFPDAKSFQATLDVDYAPVGDEGAAHAHGSYSMQVQTGGQQRHLLSSTTVVVATGNSTIVIVIDQDAARLRRRDLNRQEGMLVFWIFLPLIILVCCAFAFMCWSEGRVDYDEVARQWRDERRKASGAVARGDDERQQLVRGQFRRGRVRKGC